MHILTTDYYLTWGCHWMPETLKVGIADMKYCEPPNKITTIGLGSCVGICLYDRYIKHCALLHIMLPDSTRFSSQTNRLKFADTGIDDMVKLMEEKGSRVTSLRAKIAGGATIFNFSSTSGSGNIAVQNVVCVKAKLASYGIKIVSEDCGKNCGRTIIFDPETFELTVRTAGQQIHVI